MVFSAIKSRESTQKTKGILNVFGVYDHTNDKMFIHCYKKRNGDQFLDFIRRVDRKYDSTIKQIFLVLDITYPYINQTR
jgi:hypothetical protein